MCPLQYMLAKKLLLLLLIPILTIPVYAQESTSEIPAWVKGVANFWVEDNINDNEFLEAITFLIEHQIIKIDSTPLQNEIDAIGLDNAHLLQSIVDLKNSHKSLTEQYNEYRYNHSHKVGNIGGAQINEETIAHLQEKIVNLELVIDELETELRLKAQQP